MRVRKIELGFSMLYCYKHYCQYEKENKKRKIAYFASGAFICTISSLVFINTQKLLDENSNKILTPVLISIALLEALIALCLYIKTKGLDYEMIVADDNDSILTNPEEVSPTSSYIQLS